MKGVKIQTAVLLDNQRNEIAKVDVSKEDNQPSVIMYDGMVFVQEPNTALFVKAQFASVTPEEKKRKTSTLKIDLKTDHGYSSKGEHRINLAQWMDIQTILNQ